MTRRLLPRRLRDYRDRYEHHLMLTMAGEGVQQARDYLAADFPSATGDVFECTAREARDAALHRFAVASSAIRYRAIHHRDVEDVVAIDVALRRNETDWCEMLPAHLAERIIHRLYYGHFFCHVFHQDYILAKGDDAPALEQEIFDLLADRGARCPAEHSFGHLYHADTAVLAHFRRLDPTNSFNPGIGRATKAAEWAATRPPPRGHPATWVKFNMIRSLVVWRIPKDRSVKPISITACRPDSRSRTGDS